jgi:hypothetical protein
MPQVHFHDVVVIELEDAATDCPMDIDEVVAKANEFSWDQLFDDDDDINDLLSISNKRGFG